MRDDRWSPARPSKTTEFKVVVSGSRVKKGWDECVRAVTNNMAQAWDQLTRTPKAVSDRQTQMKGVMSHRTYPGRELEQWQYEFSSGGRLIYLVDPTSVLNSRGKQQSAGTVIVVEASVGHPKRTERVRGR